MEKKLRLDQDDSETLYRLLRQAITVSENLAKQDYPFTSYMLRVAFAALEDETREAIKASAARDMRYT